MQGDLGGEITPFPSFLFPVQSLLAVFYADAEISRTSNQHHAELMSNTDSATISHQFFQFSFFLNEPFETIFHLYKKKKETKASL
jgi:hypothetical protein